MDGAANLADEVDRLCLAVGAGRSASHRLKKLIAHLSVSEVEFRLLWTLRHAATLDQRSIAERLVVSPAQVSSSVERLRQQLLIAGVRSADDRRRQQWKITEAGLALLARATSITPSIKQEAA